MKLTKSQLKELIRHSIKSIVSEEDVMDKKIKYKTDDGEEKEGTVGGILKKGEDHPAHDKAQTMADKDKDKKPVKKTTIDANPFDKEEPKEKSKPKKDDSWMKGKDGWEILDDENVEVAKTKKYSEEQAKDEVGEYFKNDKRTNDAFTIKNDKLITEIFADKGKKQNITINQSKSYW